MINLNKRIGIISEISTIKPGLGKTAMMKYIFLLQQVYKVPLGYKFEIYTYGPYSSEVMEDIDWAIHKDILSSEIIIYPSGYSGYSLRPSRSAAEIIEKEEEFISAHKKSIEEMIALFGNKSAKELELSTTIIYIYQTFIANNWKCNIDEVSNNVYEIKPHFDISTIRNEYKSLEEQGILKKAN